MGAKDPYRLSGRCSGRWFENVKKENFDFSIGFSKNEKRQAFDYSIGRKRRWSRGRVEILPRNPHLASP